jgi:hypothetical protein
MTAHDQFWSAIEEELLPACVPMEDPKGLACTAFSYTANEMAQRLALANDPDGRAVAAILCCRATHQRVKAELSKG